MLHSYPDLYASFKHRDRRSILDTIIQVLLNSSSIFQKFSSIQKIYFKVF